MDRLCGLSWVYLLCKCIVTSVLRLFEIIVLISNVCCRTSPILITAFEPCIREPTKASLSDRATELSTPSPHSHRSADTEAQLQEGEEGTDAQQHLHSTVSATDHRAGRLPGRRSTANHQQQRYSALHTAEMTEIEL